MFESVWTLAVHCTTELWNCLSVVLDCVLLLLSRLHKVVRGGKTVSAYMLSQPKRCRHVRCQQWAAKPSSRDVILDHSLSDDDGVMVVHSWVTMTPEVGNSWHCHGLCCPLCCSPGCCTSGRVISRTDVACSKWLGHIHYRWLTAIDY